MSSKPEASSSSSCGDVRPVSDYQLGLIHGYLLCATEFKRTLGQIDRIVESGQGLIRSMERMHEVTADRGQNDGGPLKTPL